ncbi:hypothetical protein B0H63DRAFT_518176 [Podospora didyma]|uniref:Uncharacterized protein n=1 Tax=Podospora didyma TaxID=330526 RepID=A0AAE0U8V7_9PEZI|nr:hypothetical protein B0H63DRAFT_518176 [Podospora didyma]
MASRPSLAIAQPHYPYIDVYCAICGGPFSSTACQVGSSSPEALKQRRDRVEKRRRREAERIRAALAAQSNFADGVYDGGNDDDIIDMGHNDNPRGDCDNGDDETPLLGYGSGRPLVDEEHSYDPTLVDFNDTE